MLQFNDKFVKSAFAMKIIYRIIEILNIMLVSMKH